MHWLFARFYDRLLQSLEENGLSAWRNTLIASSNGKVLEVGAGTGLNLPHYPDHATVILTEPNRSMRNRLLLRLAALNGDSFEVAGAALEKLPFADCTFDTVISTLVLCSVRDLRLALREIHRVLKHEGKFLFVEHVAAENHTGRFRWQRRVEPMWKFLGGNCHLTRRTEQAILEAGFRMRLVERADIPGAALASPMIRGEAVK